MTGGRRVAGTAPHRAAGGERTASPARSDRVRRRGVPSRRRRLLLAALPVLVVGSGLVAAGEASGRGIGPIRPVSHWVPGWWGHRTGDTHARPPAPRPTRPGSAHAPGGVGPTAGTGGGGAPTTDPSSVPTPTASAPTTPATSVPATGDGQETQPPPPGPAPSGSDGQVITAGFPDEASTGVPKGTTLVAYTGPCTVRSDTVIDAKTINCGLSVTAGKLTITRSKVNGRIDVVGNASLSISDSEVDGQMVQAPALGYRNLTVQRVDVHSAQHGILCEDNCVVRDSYIHIERIPSGADWHMNAFLSNGGANNTLVHNTLRCSVPITSHDGGCTADAALFGDFGPNHQYTFDHNLFRASTQISYCAYGGTDPGKPYGTKVSGIVFRNNVFEPGTNQKCGLYGTVTSFDTKAAGNVWANNVYTDGEVVDP